MNNDIIVITKKIEEIKRFETIAKLLKLKIFFAENLNQLCNMLEKFIPLVLLKLITYEALPITESDFSDEYKFYMNKNRTITVIKYSKSPIQMSLFPIENIISNIVIDLKQFGYDTDRKIHILRFKGELPSSLRKTKDSVIIAPLTFFLPKSKINAHISFKNFFNEELYVKHIYIHSRRRWEIFIDAPKNKIKSDEKILIPFTITLPSITPLQRFVFEIHLKLHHRKIGDIDIRKMFTLSMKNKEFDFKKKVLKNNSGVSVIFDFFNKKNVRNAYNIVTVQPPHLLKEEIFIRLQPRKKETTYIKLNNVNTRKPLLFSIKNVLTKVIYFIELSIK